MDIIVIYGDKYWETNWHNYVSKDAFQFQPNIVYDKIKRKSI